MVSPGEIDALKAQLADASDGRRFVLQGGDCVEMFADCRQQTITNKIKILLQMSVILTYAARRPVVKIGRIAGQYFKPRSKLVESDGKTPVYRGDGINGVEATREGRLHDPGRLENAYYHATATLNYVRAMIAGGFADLHNPYSWNLHDIEHSIRWSDYREILEHITDAVSFMESFGGIRSDQVGNVDFFTSHEALHLGYEAALTREVDDLFYNLSAHMLWIGERTRRIDEAHVEYAKGIENPLGIKIGPTADPSEIAEVAGKLNPRREAGRLMLITRLGAGEVERRLPDIVGAVANTGVPVLWSCDPMHGNTHATDHGVKTRRFEDVLTELERTFATHDSLGSALNGVHFELTGDDVTECTGGAAELSESDLTRNYRSFCDPRLNYSQSMEMSFLIANYLRP